MISKLNIISLVVSDYDEALKFYTEILGLEVRSDVPMGPDARWLTVGVKGQELPEINLMKPNAELQGAEGAQKMTDLLGRTAPWWFGTDDCQQTYEELKAKGVKFHGPPVEYFFGITAEFEDPYGNSFSFVQAPVGGIPENSWSSQ